MNNKPDIRQQVKTAELYIRQGLFNEARDLYGSILALYHDKLKSSGRLDSKKRYELQGIIRTLENRLEVIEAKAAVYSESTDRVQIIDDNLSPENLISRGTQLKTTGFYDEAIREFETLAQRNPEYALTGLEEIAEIHLTMGNAEAATQHLEQALELVRDNPEEEFRILERIGGIQEETDQKQNALATYKEIIQRDATYGRIFRKIENLTTQLSRVPFDFGVVCRYPKWFLAISLIIAFFFIAYNPFVKTVNNVDYFTLENNPDLEFYDDLKTVFGNDEFFIIAFESDDLFSTENLEMLQDITLSLEDLEDVEDVTSLANVNEIFGGEDYFEVRQFIDEIPETPEDREILKQNALQNRLYSNNLISGDGRTAAIVIEPKVIPGDADLRKRVLNATKGVLLPYEERGMIFYIAGWTTTNYSLSQYLNADVLIFVPLTYLLITLCTWLFFRNFRITLLAILNVSICVGATRGLMGLLGIEMNNITIIIIPLVMALALCDTVHIFTHLDQQVLDRFPQPDRALSNILNRVGVPCFLTTLTTAIGFMSLMISEIPPIKQFGLVASAGMVFEFIFSFFLLPPLILFCRPEKVYRPYMAGSKLTLVLQRFMSGLFRAYPLVLILMAVIIGISAVYSTHLQVETNLIEFFKKNSPVRTNLDFVEQRLSGVGTLDISFKAKDPDAFKEPENLQVIEMVQAFAENLPGVEKATGFVDFIKEMNQAFHSEDKSFYTIPDSRELISQYLLLYDADDIEDFINADFDHARLFIRTSQHSSNEKRKLIEKLNPFLEKLDNHGLEIRITGRSLKDVLIIDALVKSQVYSLLLAVVVISIIMFMALRSVAIAALSLVPNLFPILLNFGIMGAFGIPLDTGTALIATVALGIAVDDTIHFLSEYQLKRNQGLSIPETLTHVTETKGPAIISSSMILCIGFGVMILSRFVPIIHFGLLSAIIMVTAVVGDMVLLPAIILLKKTVRIDFGVSPSK